MEKINILYIDDVPDESLDRFLNENYNNDEYNYNLIFFEPSKGYESLLNDTRIQESNIIFVDSRLFTHDTVLDKKITGEEFKFVLKKFYPFIEVIVITQNELDSTISMISKYDAKMSENTEDYYKEVISKCIENAVSNISQYYALAQRLEKNESWEKYLKEKVLNTLNGSEVYDELSKKDIDDIIDLFKKLQEQIDG